MTGSRLHDYRNVQGARPGRRTQRRVAALAALATAVVAGTLVLRSLGESAEQLRVLLRSAPVRANDGTATTGAAVEELRAAQPATLAERAPLVVPNDAHEPAVAPEGAAQLFETTGPVSGDEFVRLLEGELSSESDPEAVEELRRALSAVAP